MQYFYFYLAVGLVLVAVVSLKAYSRGTWIRPTDVLILVFLWPVLFAISLLCLAIDLGTGLWRWLWSGGRKPI